MSLDEDIQDLAGIGYLFAPSAALALQLFHNRTNVTIPFITLLLCHCYSSATNFIVCRLRWHLAGPLKEG